MRTRSIISVVLLSITACSGAHGLAPSPSESALVSVEVRCLTPLLIGEVESCVAIAHLSSGEAPSVHADSWSASPPGIVTIDEQGAVRATQDGQAVVTATYRGSKADTVVSVSKADAIRLSSLSPASALSVGKSVTFRATGFYSVDSAPTGLLSLVVRDQSGPLTSTSPVVLARGGDAFALATSLVVSASSTRLCQTVVLMVGTSVVIAPSGPSAEVVGCVNVAVP